MTSLKTFLHGIADEMSRPRDSMNPVIQIFEDNWYDTIESIKGLDDEALAKMKVPMRIIELIRKKLGGNSDTTQTKQPEKMIEETKTNTITPEEQTLLNNQISKFSWTLDQLKRETIRPQSLLDALNILEKVIGNLLKDPANETYRSLKLTNEKLKEKFFAYAGIFDALSLAGFNKKDDILYIKENEINAPLIKQMLKEIETAKQKATERLAFDPFKSSFSTTSDVNMTSLATSGGTPNYDFGQKLDELKMKRRNAVKSYIEDKEVKAFILDPQTSIQSFLSTRDQALEDEPNTEESLLRQEILRWAKEFEGNQNFTSRRRKEFEALLKEPLYTECRIRVKFPDHSILEAKFSPREPLKNVVDVVRKHLANPNWNFFLFQTPPVQKITPQNWSKSLEEAEMVPNMLLYFGTDQPLEGVKEYLNIKPEYRA